MPNHVDFTPTIPSLARLGNLDVPHQPLVTWSGRLEKGIAMGPHSFRRAQMAFSFDGLIRIEIGDDQWFIPDRHGIWIPPDARHRVTTASAVEFQAFFIHPRHAFRTGMPDHPVVVRATPLMRGVGRRLAPGAAASLSAAERRRIAWVALDEMVRLEQSDLRLPGGKDARLTATLEHLMMHPRDAGSLKRLADQVGSSERTMSRLFISETGLSWREWRDRMRFMLALEGLQEGLNSTELAARLGYSSPSAFVAAFRRRAGIPPSEWRKRR